MELKLVCCHAIQYVGFLCYRREEVSGEAQRVLRAFPTKISEKEGPKPMPSFPDMVAYVQEKVRLCTCLSLPLRQSTQVIMWSFLPKEILMNLICFCSCHFQAAQRIRTPAKYIVGTSTIPFNPSAFGEVNINW